MHTETKEQQKIRNLESAIEYMQSQHRETISDLHQEIERLQWQCSELIITPKDNEEFMYILVEKEKKKYQAQIERLHGENSRKDTEIETLNAELTAMKKHVLKLGIEFTIGHKPVLQDELLQTKILPPIKSAVYRRKPRVPPGKRQLNQ